MSALEQIVLSSFLNAVWELPVCFLCCWMFLRFLPKLEARVQHMFWLAVVWFGFLAPAGTLLGLCDDSNAISSDPKFVFPDGLSRSGVIRLLLLVFVAPALYRAFLLVRGGINANRLRNLSIAVDPRPLQAD